MRLTYRELPAHRSSFNTIKKAEVIAGGQPTGLVLCRLIVSDVPKYYFFEFIYQGKPRPFIDKTAFGNPSDASDKIREILGRSVWYQPMLTPDSHELQLTLRPREGSTAGVDIYQKIQVHDPSKFCFSPARPVLKVAV